MKEWRIKVARWHGDMAQECRKIANHADWKGELFSRPMHQYVLALIYHTFEKVEGERKDENNS